MRKAKPKWMQDRVLRRGPCNIIVCPIYRVKSVDGGWSEGWFDRLKDAEAAVRCFVRELAAGKSPEQIEDERQGVQWHRNRHGEWKQGAPRGRPTQSA